jgi:glycosyltransferase involved in cell wall biosynthesis
VHAVEEAAYMASVICPHVGLPFIYDMASAIPMEMARKPLFASRPVHAMLRQMERRVLRSASRVICSSGLADYVTRQVPDVNVREWLYPAFAQRVDAARVVALRAELGIDPDRRVLLYSGNLAGYQGVDLLMDAFDRARRIRPELLLVCVGATEKEMKSRARRDCFNREGVQIVQRQPRSRIPEFLKMADFLALPRVAAQNVPLKLFDYMASGKPIIATRGAAHEPLLNDSRAFMTDPDPQSFAGAIVKACESPVRAAAASQAAQSYARQNFGWERFVEFVRFTYCDALNEIQELRRLVA